MSTKSMKKLLDSLVAIKAATHDVADTGVNEKLDEAIKLVEQCIKYGRCSSKTTNEVLIVIGRVLDRLPSVVALLKLFSN